ncbi:hypothetical protein M2T36_27160, partial [Escherichia coli]|uniref:hypothetical protein n=1 Tax=Escherichia coli TaxID=562 RepID=UPI00200CEE05
MEVAADGRVTQDGANAGDSAAGQFAGDSGNAGTGTQGDGQGNAPRPAPRTPETTSIADSPMGQVEIIEFK